MNGPIGDDESKPGRAASEAALYTWMIFSGLITSGIFAYSEHHFDLVHWLIVNWPTDSRIPTSPFQRGAAPTVIGAVLAGVVTYFGFGRRKAQILEFFQERRSKAGGIQALLVSVSIFFSFGYTVLIPVSHLAILVLCISVLIGLDIFYRVRGYY